MPLVRKPIDKQLLQTLLEALGREARGPGTIYLVGGATAVWHGWRASSIDVDLKLDPEPAGVFEAIAKLKTELQVNIELASPDKFIPAVPGWRERSVHVGRFGEIEVYHFDLLTQALAKIERGHERDLADVVAMRLTASALRDAFAAIRSELPRLRVHGLALGPRAPGLEHPHEALYARVSARAGDGAHSAYNALIRRATSFCAALDRAPP
jgi:hypothetical protein